MPISQLSNSQPSTAQLFSLLPARQGGKAASCNCSAPGPNLWGDRWWEKGILSIHVTMEYCSREGSCPHALLFSRLSVQPLTTTRSFWTSTTAGWPLMISVSSECPPELQTHPPAPSSQCNAHRHLRRVSLQHHVRTGWGDERRFALGHQTSLNYCSEVKHLATVSVG